MASPWLSVPQSHLRQLGFTLALTAALLFGLAEDADGQPTPNA